MNMSLLLRVANFYLKPCFGLFVKELLSADGTFVSLFSVGAMVILFRMFVKLREVHLELICTLLYYISNKGLF
jgi:hypothetical protein